MKRMLIVVVLLCSAFQAMADEGFNATRAEFESQVWVVPIAPRDLTRNVRPKRGMNRIAPLLQQHKNAIKNTARALGVDSIHVAAAIAGEHAMNVGMFDSIQQYLVQRDHYLPAFVERHNAMEDNLFALTQTEAYSDCRSRRSDYNYWNCV
ncbi:MAG: DUF1402 family protein, partial [Bdellovibrionales bacterium]|nr:DUF1402 family protein [Bdellovibrionales bacterium]